MKAKEKAVKLETYRDKHFTTIVYSYRGQTYEVNYPNGWTVCCSPAWVQHRDEQEKIDKMLDNPEPITGISAISGEPIKHYETFQEEMDEIWEMMGW